MLDVTTRIILIFQHPKKMIDDKPMLVGVPLPLLLQHGPLTTKKGKQWKYISAQLVQ